MDEPLWKGRIIDYHTRRPRVMLSLRWSIRVRFCPFSLLCRRRQDSNPIVHVYLRPGEQVSGTVVFAMLHWEKANKVFGKRSSRDCSLTTTSSTSWWHLRPGDRSRDFTAYIFLHRHCTTTSTEVLPRLVWLIQRIATYRLPPATALPLGTLSSCCAFICSSWSICLVCLVYESCLH
jgi:hypothetical protein